MKDAKGHGSDPRGGALSVPEQHQMKIAKSTLRMSDAGAAIMGGMSKDQARAFLTGRVGWSADRLAAHELGQGHPKSATVPIHSGASGPQHLGPGGRDPANSSEERARIYGQRLRPFSMTKAETPPQNIVAPSRAGNSD